MNILKKFGVVGFVAASLLAVVFIAVSTQAQTIIPEITFTFSQSAGNVSAVNTAAGTIEVTYPAIQAACTSTSCPTNKPQTIAVRGLLLIDAQDNAVNDTTQIKIGDAVLVYFKSVDGGVTTTPYAIKDKNLNQPSCDPATGICSEPSGSSQQIVPVGEVIVSNLTTGANNQEVSALQRVLQRGGYFPRYIQTTGYFGPLTRKAVIEFQTDKGLPATGYVGPLTREALKAAQ